MEVGLGVVYRRGQETKAHDVSPYLLSQTRQEKRAIGSVSFVWTVSRSGIAVLFGASWKWH